MKDKKTIKISVDEQHNNFEKTKVRPTKLFDLDDLEDDLYNELNEMTTEDLKYKLKYEKLNAKEIETINKIINNRDDD